MFAKRHLLFTVNTDWFFLSHRLPLALAARDAGMTVTVLAPDTGRAEEIRDHGLRFSPLSISRSGIRPEREAVTVARLCRAYLHHAPDVIHQVTPKGVILGSMAAALTRQRAVVNAVTGLGHVFSDDRAVLSTLVRTLYRVALAPRGWRAVFQNSDDRDLFVELGVVNPAQAVLIRGSGVDTDRFRVVPEPSGTPVVMLASRMLRQKGVEYFVDAARVLEREGLVARFVLVGAPDEGAPSSVTENQLRRWNDEGTVEWWGPCADMPEVLAQAHVVVLPTYYREGLPKILLEAAAGGRALVATNVPGCREIVIPGKTGLLVPPHDTLALVRAIETLVCDPDTRSSMGRRGRALVERDFSSERVIRDTMNLYEELLRGRW